MEVDNMKAIEYLYCKTKIGPTKRLDEDKITKKEENIMEDTPKEDDTRVPLELGNGRSWISQGIDYE